jgi:hypothetical protein
MTVTSNAAPVLTIAKPSRKPRKPKPKTVQPVETTAASPKPNDGLWYWATAGVAIMAVLSAVLNGYQHSQHSPSWLAGWGMGLVVPIIVLVLGKVAGLAWKRGAAVLAAMTALAGVGLLGLSVYHCSEAIASITGSPWGLAVPMAVAIDIGLVCSEYAALQE